MKPTADNVKLILDRFFGNVKLIMQGHNIPDGRGGPSLLNTENPGLRIVSCSAEAQFVEDEDGAYIETLKHYPGDRETPPETVETFYRAYESAETAARALIDFWVDDYFQWAMEGISDDIVYGKLGPNGQPDWLNEVRTLESQADGQGQG